MKRIALGVLTSVLTFLSLGFLVIVLTMSPSPPEWSREAVGADIAAMLMGLGFSILTFITWGLTFESWRKLLRKS